MAKKLTQREMEIKKKNRKKVAKDEINR
ncbi:hypothetical protein RO1_29980 [Roseburia intestinalis XB6B4]|jgi:hypothetical protein|uniref:Uncharacterized protein n=1 Tax=Roseburia intestinalis XB6B4 TaxID=718255 RepID=D4L168_9FIRM|nr:hypothetical protein RO1_29980 [Roseburia intestinalis XB6B4]